MILVIGSFGFVDNKYDIHGKKQFRLLNDFLYSLQSKNFSMIQLLMFNVTNSSLRFCSIQSLLTKIDTNRSTLDLKVI